MVGISEICYWCFTVATFSSEVPGFKSPSDQTYFSAPNMDIFQTQRFKRITKLPLGSRPHLFSPQSFE